MRPSYDLVELFHRPHPDRHSSARYLKRIIDEAGAKKAVVFWSPMERPREVHVALSIVDRGAVNVRPVTTALDRHCDGWGRFWQLRLWPGRGADVDLSRVRGVSTLLYGIYCHLGRFLERPREEDQPPDDPTAVLINTLAQWIDLCWAPASPWREQSIWRMRTHAAQAEGPDERVCLERCAAALEEGDQSELSRAALDFSGSLTDRNQRARAEVLARVAYEAALRVLDVSLGADAARAISTHAWAQNQEHAARLWGDVAAALVQVGTSDRVVPLASGVFDLTAYRLARAKA